MVHVTDVLAVAMMLGITAQVKEAGVAWDRGEKKSKDRAPLGGPGQRRRGPGQAAVGAPVAPDGPRGPAWSRRPGPPVTRSSLSDLEVLRSFQNQIAAIQRDAVWWLHTVVPSISKLAPKDYVHW